jgi:hypothetical protein
MFAVPLYGGSPDAPENMPPSIPCACRAESSLKMPANALAAIDRRDAIEGEVCIVQTMARAVQTVHSSMTVFQQRHPTDTDLPMT